MTITYKVKNGLYVNMTNRCSCSCTFCLRNNAPGVFGSDSLWLEREPTIDEIKESFGKWNLDEFKEVVFCGYGEPTMRLEELIETARYIKSIKPTMPIRLNTNGLCDLVWKKPVAPLLKGLVDVVSISLNTPDPEEYLRICRPMFGISSWQAMLDFASSCRACVPDVVLTIVGEPVTSPENQARCREIAERLGVRLRVRRYETRGDSDHE